jgi:hypothetical protein
LILIDIDSVASANVTVNIESGASYTIEAEASFADVDFDSGNFKGNRHKKNTSIGNKWYRRYFTKRKSEKSIHHTEMLTYNKTLSL